ncbi:hypothetical protein QQF64_025692 [Cirrhinus molitorella]|uniref:Uncharacterized protein n=1 Tax=Cirrhinus molitorella TaxID=172907 RepID=A0ABR3NQ21_9TELE
MQAVVDCVRSYLQGKRNDKSYLELYEKATALVNFIKLVDPIETANSRRFAGKAVDHYRAEFFKVLDCVEVQFVAPLFARNSPVAAVERQQRSYGECQWWFVGCLTKLRSLSEFCWWFQCPNAKLRGASVHCGD